MTKTYKDFEKKYIGDSDYAALTLTGCDQMVGIKTQLLTFDGDDAYHAYIVTEDIEIPEHYEEAATFERWMRVYDDYELTAYIQADKITVYRAGLFGCIIKAINQR